MAEGRVVKIGCAVFIMDDARAVMCEHHYVLQSSRQVRTLVNAWAIYSNDKVSKPRRRGVREYCRLESLASCSAHVAELNSTLDITHEIRSVCLMLSW